MENKRYKYRGKYKDGQKERHREWVYGWYCEDLHDSSIAYIGTGPYGWVKVDPKTVGQCTGLVDSKGQEVYEGDIVECDAPHLECKKVKVTIYWNETLAKYTAGAKMAGMWESIEEMIDTNHIVTGNIHDNK